VGLACRSGQEPPVITVTPQGTIQIQHSSGILRARVNDIDGVPFLERT